MVWYWWLMVMSVQMCGGAVSQGDFHILPSNAPFGWFRDQLLHDYGFAYAAGDLIAVIVSTVAAAQTSDHKTVQHLQVPVEEFKKHVKELIDQRIESYKKKEQELSAWIEEASSATASPSIQQGDPPNRGEQREDDVLRMIEVETCESASVVGASAAALRISNAKQLRANYAQTRSVLLGWYREATAGFDRAFSGMSTASLLDMINRLFVSTALNELRDTRVFFGGDLAPLYIRLLEEVQEKFLRGLYPTLSSVEERERCFVSEYVYEYCILYQGYAYAVALIQGSMDQVEKARWVFYTAFMSEVAWRLTDQFLGYVYDMQRLDLASVKKFAERIPVGERVRPSIFMELSPPITFTAALELPMPPLEQVREALKQRLPRQFEQQMIMVVQPLHYHQLSWTFQERVWKAEFLWHRLESGQTIGRFKDAFGSGAVHFAPSQAASWKEAYGQTADNVMELVLDDESGADPVVRLQAELQSLLRSVTK